MDDYNWNASVKSIRDGCERKITSVIFIEILLHLRVNFIYSMFHSIILALGIPNMRNEAKVLIKKTSQSWIAAKCSY